MPAINFLLIYCFWLSLLLNGCTSRELSPREYSLYMSDETNGLKKKKIINEYEFVAQYKPVDFVIAGEYKDQLTYEAYLSRKKELGDGLYFTLSIKHGSQDLFRVNAESAHEFEQRKYYYSFDFSNDIYIEVNGRRLPCSLFHFEGMYDKSGYKIFHLGFESTEDPVTSMTLIIDSRVLGLGPVKLSFTKKDLYNIPRIGF